jgi:hypothetical protein
MCNLLCLVVPLFASTADAHGIAVVRSRLVVPFTPVVQVQAFVAPVQAFSSCGHVQAVQVHAVQAFAVQSHVAQQVVVRQNVIRQVNVQRVIQRPTVIRSRSVTIIR